MKFKIKIDSKITEQMLVENCLNYKHSGYSYEALLLFYALEKSWHVNKLTYYLGLLGE